jgi:hypothetical protein
MSFLRNKKRIINISNLSFLKMIAMGILERFSSENPSATHVGYFPSKKTDLSNIRATSTILEI